MTYKSNTISKSAMGLAAFLGLAFAAGAQVAQAEDAATPPGVAPGDWCVLTTLGEKAVNLPAGATTLTITASAKEIADAKASCGEKFGDLPLTRYLGDDFTVDLEHQTVTLTIPLHVP